MIHTNRLLTIAGDTLLSVVSHGAAASTRWAGSRLNRILLLDPITIENKKFRSAKFAAKKRRDIQPPGGPPRHPAAERHSAPSGVGVILGLGVVLVLVFPVYPVLSADRVLAWRPGDDR